ncbi:MAG: M28 family peptidase [Candidatus Zixiibacteriota bacterium]|nr:MAG: M28 family peptidase [candidate division Zixibacteria bacterium]
MKKVVVSAALVLCLLSTSLAADLYKVTLRSQKNAESLRAVDAEILLKVTDGYLVLAEQAISEAMEQRGLDLELLASNVERSQLVLDARFDGKNADIFEVLYEDGPQRLLLANADRLALAGEPIDVHPIPDRFIKVAYDPPIVRHRPDLSAAVTDDIELLLAEIKQDSLLSYVLALQSYMVRLAGTPESYAARDWIAAKFDEFGYDPVEIDPFTGAQCWSYTPVPAYNVIARKIGTLYPDQYIVVGGHFDAVPLSPGADDNASGTAAVLEVARVLKDVPTAMSFVFIALDSEEGGLQGAYHYAQGALQRDEDIVLMINLDMIAHLPNSTRANVYYGSDPAYAEVWRDMANTYCGITITDFLSGGASDQRAFWEAGYDAIFVQEDQFSDHWHLVTDSTVYMNFEYMTRMVQASLAAAVTVNEYPPPVRIASILQTGDGMSLLINWHEVNSPDVSYYRLTFGPTAYPGDLTTIDLPATQSSHTIEGLIEGQEYALWVEAFNSDGLTSLTYDRHYATPCSIPVSPFNVLAMPIPDAVRVTWNSINTELDFDYFAVVRDGAIVGQTDETTYIDDDPALGTDLHYYYVMAVDIGANESDTVGVEPSWTKAATLQQDRILAVNRTSIHSVDFADEIETSVFMREALAGYNFDYMSDTVAITCGTVCDRLSLMDMVDYELVVIGAEAGKYDDIGIDPRWGGILDTLGYYLSIGGKAIIFGRWGDWNGWDTLDYISNFYSYDNVYYTGFNIDLRIKPETVWPTFSTVLYCDLIGAHPAADFYPELVWDSLLTLAHANDGSPTITEVGGIPCVSFIEPNSPEVDVIYTYNSRDDDPLTEGQPVAWRYIGPDYRYIYFDIPLSCFERTSAIDALCRAVDEMMGSATPVDDIDDSELPGSISLSQNYPNPFNPATEISYSLAARTHVSLSIFNILGQRVATIVDGVKPAGTHTVRWNGIDDSGREVSTGIYFYQVKAGDHTESRKMILLK